MSAAEQARNTNMAMYGDGEHVGGYITDPYHRVRREIAAHALTELLGRPDSPDGPILEIGAGPESITNTLDVPLAVIASDIALDALKSSAASRRVCFDATKPFPFADESVSAVVMGELIEHIYEPAETLQECHRILQPSGGLVITTPNLAGLQDRVRFLAGLAPRQVDPLHPYLRLHIRPFSASSLRSMLRVGGFEPLSLRSNFVGWELPSGKWLQSRILAKVLPSIGGSLIMSARKISS